MCIALNRTPSELEQTLTLDDYYFFLKCSSIEPLPSSKIDIGTMFIRSEIRNIMSTGERSDLTMPWNKEPVIRLEDLPIEEQAKKAIERIVNLRMDSEKEERAIKGINEKLKRMQKAQKKDG